MVQDEIQVSQHDISMSPGTIFYLLRLVFVGWFLLPGTKKLPAKKKDWQTGVNPGKPRKLFTRS